jgi:hypothetical protein
MRQYLVAKRDVNITLPLPTNDVYIEIKEGSKVQVVYVFGIAKNEISVAFVPNVDEYEFGTGVVSADDFRIEVE